MSEFLEALQVFENNLICNYNVTTKVEIVLPKNVFDHILTELSLKEHFNFRHKLTKSMPFRRIISFEVFGFIVRRKDCAGN